MPDPLLVDLYCGAGGCSAGYARAGFRVLGVDHRPQPRYPFTFVQADALTFLASADLALVAAIHASPPCRDRSLGTPRGTRHPSLVGATRQALERTGKPWVIENVPPRPGAEPLRPDLICCGCMFGLDRLERVRWFETSWRAFELRQPCQAHSGPVVTVWRHGAQLEWGRWSGQGRTRVHVDHEQAADLMGIDWMSQRELGDAVPPVYAEHVGRHLMTQVTAAGPLHNSPAAV